MSETLETLKAALADRRRNEPRLRIPRLILWGSRDSGFPRSEQEALLAAIPGAALKVSPETGHALHWQRPAEFVRDLDAFLARS